MDPFCRDNRSLQIDPLFRIIRAEISDWGTPFKYLLERYFPFLKLTNRGHTGLVRTILPLGPRREIYYVLQKA